MIRQAKKEDSQRIWQIRNHPLNRKNSHDQKEIDFDSHNKWFVDKYFKNKDNCCFVLEEDSKVIGYCRFDLNGAYVVSIAIDPDYHGKGFGSKLLKESLEKMKKKIKKDMNILATIKKGNVPSVKLFEKCNFYLYKEDTKNLYYKHD